MHHGVTLRFGDAQFGLFHPYVDGCVPHTLSVNLTGKPHCSRSTTHPNRRLTSTVLAIIFLNKNSRDRLVFSRNLIAKKSQLESALRVDATRNFSSEGMSTKGVTLHLGPWCRAQDIFIYTYIHIYIYTYIYIYIYIYIFLRIYRSIYLSIYIYMYIYIYIYIYKYKHISICMSMYVCIYIYTHKYVYMYIL